MARFHTFLLLSIWIFSRLISFLWAIHHNFHNYFVFGLIWCKWRSHVSKAHCGLRKGKVTWGQVREKTLVFRHTNCIRNSSIHKKAGDVCSDDTEFWALLGAQRSIWQSKYNYWRPRINTQDNNGDGGVISGGWETKMWAQGLHCILSKLCSETNSGCMEIAHWRISIWNFLLPMQSGVCRLCWIFLFRVHSCEENRICSGFCFSCTFLFSFWRRVSNQNISSPPHS